MATLLAGGLLAWWPRRLQFGAAMLITSGLAILVAVTPFVWIAPAFTPPSPLAVGEVIPNPVEYPFGDAVHLVGYDLRTDEARPGGLVELTLYWRTGAPLPADYSVFVHATDETDVLQAQVDSYPGGGLSPTSTWVPGATIVDRYRLRVPTTVNAPSRLRIDIGVYDHATGERLPTPGARPFVVGYVSVPPPSGANNLPNATTINFDDKFALVGYALGRRTMSPGETLELTLWWEVLRPPGDDYKVFTHLLLPPDAVWSQDDHALLEGATATATWRVGDRIKGRYLLTLPPEAPTGNYSVEIGLYDPDTSKRLRVGFSDKGVPLGWVRVAP